MEPRDQLAVIIPTLIEIVDELGAEQLDNPTPCTNFTVHGVLDHMMGGASAFIPAFLGEAAGDDVTEATISGTPDGQVPAAEFRAAMTGLLEAVNAPGAMDRMIDAPFGRVPGSVFARFVAFDGLIHGWDLSTATSRAYEPPADVVADVSAFAHEALGPDMRDGDTFAVETTAPDGADALIQLVAFSGRAV
jgi:uncharacterized protein (TIGR03086 family)